MMSDPQAMGLTQHLLHAAVHPRRQVLLRVQQLLFSGAIPRPMSRRASWSWQPQMRCRTPKMALPTDSFISVLQPCDRGNRQQMQPPLQQPRLGTPQQPQQQQELETPPPRQREMGMETPPPRQRE